MRKKHLAFIVGLILCGAGLYIPYWPFLLFGIFTSSLMYPFAGVFVGFIADIFFGAPPGLLHGVFVPFTLLGFLAGTVSIFASARLRSRNLY